MLSSSDSGANNKAAKQAKKATPPYKVAKAQVFRPKPKIKRSSGGSYSGGSSSTHSAPPVSYSTPSPPPSSTSQGTVSGVGRGGGQRNAGPPPPPPPPPPPSIKKYIRGDNVYQDQIDALRKELKDFRVDNRDQRGDVRQAFQTARGRLRDERSQSLEDIEADFASRGLLNSGLYADAVGDYNTEFQNRMGDLVTDRRNTIEDLLKSMGMYTTSNQNERSSARQEAIRRRAQEYGLK